MTEILPSNKQTIENLKDRLYPLDSDICAQLNTIGFKLDNFII